MLYPIAIIPACTVAASVVPALISASLTTQNRWLSYHGLHTVTWHNDDKMSADSDIRTQFVSFNVAWTWNKFFRYFVVATFQIKKILIILAGNCCGVCKGGLFFFYFVLRNYSGESARKRPDIYLEVRFALKQKFFFGANWFMQLHNKRVPGKDWGAGLETQWWQHFSSLVFPRWVVFEELNRTLDLKIKISSCDWLCSVLPIM